MTETTELPPGAIGFKKPEKSWTVDWGKLFKTEAESAATQTVAAVTSGGALNIAAGIRTLFKASDAFSIAKTDGARAYALVCAATTLAVYRIAGVESADKAIHTSVAEKLDAALINDKDGFSAAALERPSDLPLYQVIRADLVGVAAAARKGAADPVRDGARLEHFSESFTHSQHV